VLDARRDNGGGAFEPHRVVAPDGAWATAAVTDDARLLVQVACGDPLDETVLRSYCIGAAHMALSWVTSEGLVVDAEGSVHDLTIRSFGIMRASAMPTVEVTIVHEVEQPEPANGSDAVFAAVAAAVWAHQGCPPQWPTGRVLSARP
jgi:xanthine dehydrogenase small subunit